MRDRVLNEIKLGIFTVLLGAACGTVVWLFLRILGICTDLIWERLPELTGTSWAPVFVCVAGGFAAGLLHKKYGDHPEELPVVLGKIKKTKHYEYHPMLVILVSAFLPLMLGASVGPEAGLTGIIAGLCYWVGDNVKYAKEHAAEYSEIGAAVTLGSLFHVPLFGIFAVEEDPEGGSLKERTIPRTSKLVLYGLAIGAAFLMMKLLGSLFGAAAEGFAGFDDVEAGVADYVLILLYIPVGIGLYLAFKYAEIGTKAVAGRIPVIARETLCGLVVGLLSLAAPVALFSGEKEMGELPETYLTYTPLLLAGICLLKLLMTAFCIQFGLKGGHFFPLIFACSCMGFAVASLLYGTIAGVADPAAIAAHAVFGAAIITAATLGAKMRKPLAVSLLLLICFPLRLILWTLLAAALGSKIIVLIEGEKLPQTPSHQ